jgi:hypothetical protein
LQLGETAPPQDNQQRSNAWTPLRRVGVFHRIATAAPPLSPPS